jgi:hypothetical protein
LAGRDWIWLLWQKSLDLANHPLPREELCGYGKNEAKHGQAAIEHLGGIGPAHATQAGTIQPWFIWIWGWISGWISDWISGDVLGHVSLPLVSPSPSSALGRLAACRICIYVLLMQ